MANVKFSRKEIEKHIKVTKEIEEKISLFGTHLESINDEEIELEVMPNRPDLLSMHGWLRGFLAFTGKKIGLQKYKLGKPEKNFEVEIDKSVSEVRPFTACAIVKGLKFDSEKIKEIIDIQEKLHTTLGRNRKKIAIGIYPLEKITLPIKYEARAPEEIKFVPLEAHAEMNGKQILQSHPTGREYAHLLEGAVKFPVFVDSNNEILSMPPIINSHKTGKITEETKEVFIECSGFDFEILKKTLNILVTVLSDMGGDIYQMTLRYKKDKEPVITPDFEPEKIKLSVENANKLLGLELNEKDAEKYLEKMGYNYDSKNKTAEIPAWRTDILHENDLIEDIAIAYGYENFTPEIPNISTQGQEDFKETSKRKIAQMLAGLNILEISNYHLTTSQDQFKNMGQKKENLIEIENSKTEYNLLRQNLVHYAMKILSQNVDSEYPQRIFELGRVFSKDSKEQQETKINEHENLCIALADNNANFTEIKQTLDYIMRMLGKEKALKIEPAENNYFISGRCGKILIEGKEAGFLGEIAPNILSNLKIKMPVVALEMNIEKLM